MLWEVVCRANPGVPRRSVLFGASVDVSSPAVLMAGKVRKMMPGTSERYPRDVYMYWGMTQSLEVKREQNKGVEGWLYHVSDPPAGHSGEGGCFTRTLAPSEI